MRIAVMGSGGVGGYFGGRLAASGEDVTFIARGAHLDAIRQRGLVITSALGDPAIRPAKATDDPAEIGPVDLVIFTVKLYDSEHAADAIRPMAGPGTGVVTFQNGVDSTDVLAARREAAAEVAADPAAPHHRDAHLRISSSGQPGAGRYYRSRAGRQPALGLIRKSTADEETARPLARRPNHSICSRGAVRPPVCRPEAQVIWCVG